MTEKGTHKKTNLFLVAGIVALIVALTGFSTTFILPMARGTFTTPTIIHIHGALAFSWICLFIVQSTLVKTNKVATHMTLGYVVFIVALGLTVTFIPVGLYQIEREQAQGLGQTAISSIVGTVTSAIIFLSLVIFGMLKRKQSATHKRLMLLATILLLWPAWFRFRHIFPSVPNPEIWFAVVLADSMIIFSILWDRIRYGKFDNTFSVVGLLIILDHVVEAWMFDSASWRICANAIYRLLV